MGIKRLALFVAHHDDALGEDVDRHVGSTAVKAPPLRAVIAGTSLTSYLLERVGIHGDFIKLGELAREFVMRLSGAGVAVHAVVFDGHRADGMRDAALTQTRRQRLLALDKTFAPFSFHSRVTHCGQPGRYFFEPYTEADAGSPRSARELAGLTYGREYLTPMAEFEVARSLADAGVRVVRSDGDADNATATLAAHLGAIVIAQDSDHFVLCGPEGYAPLSMLYLNERGLHARRYRREILASMLFKPRTPDDLASAVAMLPLWASLVGSDVVPEELLLRFHTRVEPDSYGRRDDIASRVGARILSVAAYLRPLQGLSTRDILSRIETLIDVPDFSTRVAVERARLGRLVLVQAAQRRTGSLSSGDATGYLKAAESVTEKETSTAATLMVSVRNGERRRERQRARRALMREEVAASAEAKEEARALEAERASVLTAQSSAEEATQNVIEMFTRVFYAIEFYSLPNSAGLGCGVPDALTESGTYSSAVLLGTLPTSMATAYRNMRLDERSVALLLADRRAWTEPPLVRLPMLREDPRSEFGAARAGRVLRQIMAAMLLRTQFDIAARNVAVTDNDKKGGEVPSDRWGAPAHYDGTDGRAAAAAAAADDLSMLPTPNVGDLVDSSAGPGVLLSTGDVGVVVSGAGGAGDPGAGNPDAHREPTAAGTESGADWRIRTFDGREEIVGPHEVRVASYVEEFSERGELRREVVPVFNGKLVVPGHESAVPPPSLFGVGAAYAARAVFRGCTGASQAAMALEPPPLRLPAAALSYWASHSIGGVPASTIAVACCVLVATCPASGSVSVRRKPTEDGPEEVEDADVEAGPPFTSRLPGRRHARAVAVARDAAHSAAEWLGVLDDVSRLNLMLRTPVPPLRPRFAHDGELWHRWSAAAQAVASHRAIPNDYAPRFADDKECVEVPGGVRVAIGGGGGTDPEDAAGGAGGSEFVSKEAKTSSADPTVDRSRHRTRASSVANALVEHGSSGGVTYLADILEELRLVAERPETAVSRFRAVFNAAVGGLGAGCVVGRVIVGRPPEVAPKRRPAPKLPPASSAFEQAFGADDDSD